ncbi:MAG: hypothetical protein HZA50_10330 [Planctomycetes bacterium]|nr:hypothetical protein [Planctomycetota bacterium]
MTIRSMVIGLLVALFIATYGYINDSIMRLSFIVGNHLPISVFGFIIIWAVAVNPVLYMIRPSWRFQPGELATMMILALVACSIPGSSTLRVFTQALVLPAKYNNTESGWKDKKVLSYVPPAMLVADGKYDKAVIDQYEQGKPKGHFVGFSTLVDGKPDFRLTGFGDFPSRQWSKPLLVWAPLILLCSIAVICLSLVVHRQWSSHERLRYPIAQFAGALMEQEPGRPMGSVFRSKLFWIGLGIAFIIYVVNGYYVWNPDSIQIPLVPVVDCRSIPFKYTKLMQSLNNWTFLFTPRIYLAVMAFAFLLSAEVSFSLGISQVLIVLTFAWLTTSYNFDLSGDNMQGGNMVWQRFGSYLGLAIMLLYVGRRYYWDVLKSAVTFQPSTRGVESYAIWACRCFIVAVAAMVVIMAFLGLSWPFALILTVLIMMLFLVISRVNAESGLFFIQPGWMPVCVLVGLFGTVAIGPKAIILMALICTILCLDPRECLMPFVVNALKIGEQQKIRPSRTGAVGTGAYAIVLAAGVLTMLWAVYSYGYSGDNDKFAQNSAKGPFTLGLWAVTDLKQQEMLQTSENMGDWQRFISPNPNSKFFPAAGIGVGLVLLTSLLRLRFTWWPLHPIIFLVWGTWPIQEFSHSFLAGWLINLAVTKFGGSSAYRTVRSLMFGLIAGHLLAGLVFMAHGAGYYLFADLQPKKYLVFTP